MKPVSYFSVKIAIKLEHLIIQTNKQVKKTMASQTIYLPPFVLSILLTWYEQQEKILKEFNYQNLYFYIFSQLLKPNGEKYYLSWYNRTARDGQVPIIVMITSFPSYSGTSYRANPEKVVGGGQKIWILSLSIFAIFINFSSISCILWHFLVTKKLTTPAYNSWCQHFFTFNIL